MEKHYNAFISYRHHPQDIRAASGIQRALERYKIPKALRARVKDGIHIFRDKEELPITSNLTDDLTRALLNSDFLIVICSTHTKESIWVQREIETFLKTHPKNRVLTVLVDGEPYDVIPEILQYDEVTDPLTGQVVRIPIEPLSCDWRVTDRRGQKAELARLAAALLGCGYDELRQRQRQYRMRQIIAGFSCALTISLAFTAYFVYTSIQIQKANEALQEANVQIQNNYEEALRNQSQYLTEASAQRLEAGDRLTAMALAMEALPNGNGSRPYYPPAEKALNEALGTYAIRDEVVAVGSFNPGALVQDFVVTDDGGMIYIQDARGQISAWDTRTFQRLSTVDFGNVSFLPFSVTAEGNLLVHTAEKKLYCYGSDGSRLWEVENCYDHAFQDEKKILLVMEYDASLGTTIRFLDPVTGEEIRPGVMVQEEEKQYYSFAEKVYSEGGITLQYNDYDESYNNVYTVCQVNPETGERISLMESSAWVRCVTSTPDGKILVMVSDGSGYYNGFYMGMETTGASRDLIRCYDRYTRQLLWESDCVSYVYSGHYRMEVIPGTNQVLCQKDNVFQVLELETGAVLGECQAPSGVLSMTVESEDAQCVLQDGSYCRYVYAEDTCYSFQYMEDNLTAGIVNKGIFTIHSLGTQVTVYRTLAAGEWNSFSGDYDLFGKELRVHDGLLAVKDYSFFCVFDMEQERLLWSAETASSDRLLGFSRDGAKLWVLRKGDKEVLSFDALTGSVTAAPLPDADAWERRILNSVQLAQDRLYYLEREDAVEHAVCLDLNTMDGIRVTLPEREAFDPWDSTQYTAYAMAGNSYAWLCRSDGAFYEIDWAKGSVMTRAQGLESFPAMALREDGTVAAACDQEVLFFLPGEEAASGFSLDERKAGSLCWYGDELLALCDDGALWRYSMDGTVLSRTELELFNTFFREIVAMQTDPQAVTWEFTNEGDLLLNAFSAGNLVDCDTWLSKGFIEQYLTYYTPQNRILANFSGRIASICRYDTEQLMSMAQEELNGFSLSPEQRGKYGLD